MAHLTAHAIATPAAAAGKAPTADASPKDAGGLEAPFAALLDGTDADGNGTAQTQAGGAVKAAQVLKLAVHATPSKSSGKDGATPVKGQPNDLAAAENPSQVIAAATNNATAAHFSAATPGDAANSNGDAGSSPAPQTGKAANATRTDKVATLFAAAPAAIAAGESKAAIKAAADVPSAAPSKASPSGQKQTKADTKTKEDVPAEPQAAPQVLPVVAQPIHIFQTASAGSAPTPDALKVTAADAKASAAAPLGQHDAQTDQSGEAAQSAQKQPPSSPHAAGQAQGRQGQTQNQGQTQAQGQAQAHGQANSLRNVLAALNAMPAANAKQVPAAGQSAAQGDQTDSGSAASKTNGKPAAPAHAQNQMPSAAKPAQSNAPIQKMAAAAPAATAEANGKSDGGNAQSGTSGHGHHDGAPSSHNAPPQAASAKQPAVAANVHAQLQPTHTAHSAAPASDPSLAAQPNMAPQPAQAHVMANLHLAAQPQGAGSQPLPLSNLGALAVSIAAQSRNGTKQFNIALHPQDLGSINVHLSVDHNGTAQAHLSADNPQTLQLLQRDSSQLANALKDAGLNLAGGGLSFSLRGQDRQNDGGAQRSNSRNLSVSAVAATGAASESASPVYSLAPGSVRLDIRV